MRCFIPVTLVGSLSAAGCSAFVPRYDIPSLAGRPSLKAIEAHIRCELAEVAAEPNNLLVDLDAAVSVQVNLDTNDTAGIAPTFSYMAGIFSFNAGANLAQSREQSFNANLRYSMKQISAEFSKPGAYDICSPGSTNLEGRLGIKENIDLAGTTDNLDAGFKAAGTNGAFGGFVQYLVTKNLNAVGPTFTLKHFTGPGRFASISDVNTDKIIYGVAFPSPGETKESKYKRADNKIQDVIQNSLNTQLALIRAGLGN